MLTPGGGWLSGEPRPYDTSRDDRPRPHGAEPDRLRPHQGPIRTFLFNWLFARQRDGVCLLRIENTDTSREVEDAVGQIQSSLLWLGIDWDGPVSFQLDTADKAREAGRAGSCSEGKAYEDEGAIPASSSRAEGTVWWDDVVRGRIEFQHDKLADLVIVRADGRPTYNFVSPVDDIADQITHVIRGQDHVSNTPTPDQHPARDRRRPSHAPRMRRTSSADDGKKLSKRHGAVSVDVFRELGYLPDALGELHPACSAGASTTRRPSCHATSWSSGSRSEPGGTESGDVRLREARLAERRPPARPPARGCPRRPCSARGCASERIEWDDATVAATAPLVQEKIERFDQYPDFVRFLFEDHLARRRRSRNVPRGLTMPGSRRSTTGRRRRSRRGCLRALADELRPGRPRQAFAPIRLAVTGSKVSPGLFESIELRSTRARPCSASHRSSEL